jgi:hypothetical protein
VEVETFEDPVLKKIKNLTVKIHIVTHLISPVFILIPFFLGQMKCDILQSGKYGISELTEI